MFKNEVMADLLVLNNWMENELFILHSSDATSKNSNKSGLFYLTEVFFSQLHRHTRKKKIRVLPARVEALH